MALTWYVPHPYGVFPEGNATATADLNDPEAMNDEINSTGDHEHLRPARRFRPDRFGQRLSRLPAALLQDSLLPFLDVPSAAALASTSAGYYCLVHNTELWKTLAIQLSEPGAAACESPGMSAMASIAAARNGAASTDVTFGVDFVENWKTTAVRAFCLLAARRAAQGSASAVSEAMREAPHSFVHRPMRIARPLFHDGLFQQWLCTTMPPDHGLPRDVLTGKPTLPTASLSSEGQSALARGGTPGQFLPVMKVEGLDADGFRRLFEEPNLPVILPDIAKAWPLRHTLGGDFEALRTKKDEIFDFDKIRRKKAAASKKDDVCTESSDDAKKDPLFRCEAATMTVAQYVQYACRQQDERPTYLFDADFADHMRPGMYTVPPHFGRDDLFHTLGASKRPNHRWLIAGPARGGSSFHVDPNYTNAWNTCLTGRKRWILFPPNVVPPGVKPSEDMSHVATPVSITEWFLNFYEQAKRQFAHVGYECICEAGETMFVPCGWWHLVINLEDSVAVTQNYVSACNVQKVLKFLKWMPASISGLGEEDADPEVTERRRRGFYKECADAFRTHSADIAALVDDFATAEDKRSADTTARREKRARVAAALSLGNENGGVSGAGEPSEQKGPRMETTDAAAEGFTFEF